MDQNSVTIILTKQNYSIEKKTAHCKKVLILSFGIDLSVHTVLTSNSAQLFIILCFMHSKI